MNELIIPTIPAGVVVLLNFFAPYAVSIAINPRWPEARKKLVAIAISVLLALVVMLLAFFGFGVEIPSWPSLIVLAVVVCQASYALVTKPTADQLARTAGVGAHG